ncbi:hypothetical protein BC831DRAFT_176638 [Entophlyctis helioformis]|nr:hypothetical protein BC831DRAFT_176638 [Entophlyctis helioformis]
MARSIGSAYSAAPPRLCHLQLVVPGLAFAHQRHRPVPLPDDHVSSGVRILVQYFYASTQSIALVVLVIFWLLLRGAIAEFSDSFASLFFVVSPHVLNFVQTLVELFLGKLPLPLSHIGYMIVTVVMYTVYSWILHYAFSVPFPYPFFDELLDVKNTPGKSAIASIAFLAFFSTMYLFVWALGLLRNWILKSAIEADKKLYGADDEPQTQTSDTIA